MKLAEPLTDEYRIILNQNHLFLPSCAPNVQASRKRIYVTPLPTTEDPEAVPAVGCTKRWVNATVDGCRNRWAGCNS